MSAPRRAVTIRRIRDPDDPDVAPALKLYARRIPPQERDEPERLVRALRAQRNEPPRGPTALVDYFLVARIGETAAGFAYLDVNPAAALGFFSYLVVDETVPEARGRRVALELVRHARELLVRSGQCTAVVFEVEEPTALDPNRAQQAAARIRRFRALARLTGWPLKTLAIDYAQPKLMRGTPREREVPMRLMYAPLDATREPTRLRKPEVERILDFLARCVYGDHAEDGSEFDRTYSAYLEDWKARILRTVPDVVELR